MDPAVARFLARHTASPRDSVEQDVARYRGMTPEQRLEELVDACRLAFTFVPAGAAGRDALWLEDPPHPSYHALIARLRRAIPR